ncbi:Os03g0668033 [Oryza sativa Japonica Group]|uniref:Os03g0668033 protein n=1 Tax=Oryza sativa subsp. japonica TaxID=39947 RepID=A0A0P0W1R8_ORYSJ|nr:hypothetical protein EE612_019532 [Oryza sativa]BAS85659.1 Os03g0668033 [Oryza sativa Japonica Group]
MRLITVRQSDAMTMCCRPSSFARPSARLIASASASSGSTTSLIISEQATRHFPVLSRIKAPTPIVLDELKIAASELIIHTPAGSGCHLGMA